MNKEFFFCFVFNNETKSFCSIKKYFPLRIEKMKLFGEKVGMAFQIKDDLFDYGTKEIGKPLGIDIKEKKMTLPLIHALQKSSWLEKKSVIRKVRNNKKSGSVEKVIQFVHEKDGISYAESVMNRYMEEAMEILNTFESNDYRESLKDMVHFTIDRDK